MFRKALYILSIFILFSCNKNKNSEKNIESKIAEPEKKEIEKKKLTFDDKLLDSRDINDKLNEDLLVENFGMQKINDSIFAFVFKLDSQTTNEMVEKYSVGMKGYSQEHENPILFNFSPSLSVLENKNYLVLKRKIKTTRHFDSLDVYIYERKNWKKSGKLGEIMIHDILFE